MHPCLKNRWHLRWCSSAGILTFRTRMFGRWIIKWKHGRHRARRKILSKRIRIWRMHLVRVNIIRMSTQLGTLTWWIQRIRFMPMLNRALMRWEDWWLIRKGMPSLQRTLSWWIDGSFTTCCIPCLKNKDTVWLNFLIWILLYFILWTTVKILNKLD